MELLRTNKCSHFILKTNIPFTHIHKKDDVSLLQQKNSIPNENQKIRIPGEPVFKKYLFDEPRKSNTSVNTAHENKRLRTLCNMNNKREPGKITFEAQILSPGFPGFFI